MPHDTPLISTIVVGLSLAFVLGTLAQRLRLSPLVGYLVAGVLVGPHTPGFVVDHFVKDMGIALGEAKRAKLSLPGLALAEQLYVALQAQGHGGKGTQSLVLALASLSDVDWEAR